jgi:hypothetical protein
VDLFTGHRVSDESRMLLAGYLETASKVGRMTPQEFFATFGGELGQVVRHYPGVGPEEAGRRAFELYRRHAGQVNGVTTAAIRDNAEAVRLRTLPDTCLLLQVTGGAARAEPSTSQAISDELPGGGGNYFRWHGKAWVVGFAGGERNILLPTRGAAYLHRLLCAPDRTLTALSLACSVYGHERQFLPGSGTERLDAEGLQFFRGRYEELQDELAEARQAGDAETVERILTDMAALAEAINRSKGLGKHKRLDDDVIERVRKAVGNAVRRTVREIGQFDAPLAAHLRRPNLTIGRELGYFPPDGIVWLT